MANPWDNDPIIEDQPIAPWENDPIIDSGAEYGPVAQFGAGTNEGIANALGFPVDAVASGISGLGELTGLWGPIQNPVGGSESIKALLEPFYGHITPSDDDVGRAARIAGREIGAAAAFAPVGIVSAPARGTAAVVEAASALGSGAGAGTANYFAPDSELAQLAGAVLGGGAGIVGAARALDAGSTPIVTTGGTIESQQQRAADAYARAASDPTLLSPQQASALQLDFMDRAIRSGIDPDLTPNASRLEDVMQRRIGPNMDIMDVEDLRRLTMGSLPTNASPTEQRIAQQMKSAVTDFIDNLNTPGAEALREGRDATRRYRAAEAILAEQSRGVRRAGSSNSGGNEVNAIRQRLRTILDSPQKQRSFTRSELQGIEDVVMGTTEQNMLRRLSNLAPSKGGLMTHIGLGGVVMNPAVATPLILSTEAAKLLSERSTRRSVDDLVSSLLDRRVVNAGQLGPDALAAALLGSRAIANSEAN